ncbi:MAG: hypothetical protein WCX31_04500 [Salinivirgaceae bacterium]
MNILSKKRALVNEVCENISDAICLIVMDMDQEQNQEQWQLKQNILTALVQSRLDLRKLAAD